MFIVSCGGTEITSIFSTIYGVFPAILDADERRVIFVNGDFDDATRKFASVSVYASSLDS